MPGMEGSDPRAPRRALADACRKDLAGGRARLCSSRGGSMRPLIVTGTAMHLRSATAREIRPGDVVVFAGDAGLVAHRVIRILARPERLFLVTKGDALGAPDTPVDERELVGRVVAIERWGRVLRLDGGPGRMLNSIAALLSPLNRWPLGLARAARRLLGS